MNICQSETLSTPFRDLYIFAKKNQGPLCYKSWEAHLQNYMYAVPEQCRSVDRSRPISWPCKKYSRWYRAQLESIPARCLSQLAIFQLDVLLVSNIPARCLSQLAIFPLGVLLVSNIPARCLSLVSNMPARCPPNQQYSRQVSPRQ